MNTKKTLFCLIIILQTFFGYSQTSDDIKVVKTNYGTEVGSVVDGFKEGKWIYYDNNNILHKIANFTKDTLSGKLLKFDSKGNLSMILSFKNNRLNGEAYFYSNEGILLAIYIYNNDILKTVKHYLVSPESPPRSHSYSPDYN
jgi:antitoxin component YwqK of YwqJK toxin-antitoxin module